MTIESIVNQNSINQDESIFLIEEYVKEKKGRFIKASNPIHVIDVHLMVKMANISFAYFEKKLKY